jgi:hypothetical protein
MQELLREVNKDRKWLKINKIKLKNKLKNR